VSDVEVVESIYAAMAARDFDGLFALIDSDVELTQDPRLPWGGHFTGHDGVAEFAMKLTGTIDSAVTMLGMFSADDEVVQMGRTKGTVVATGVEFDVPEVHRWRIRDGKAVSAHFSIDTELMLSALAAPGAGDAPSS
jgi:ketosteroid isomerase-like protein